MPPSDPQHNGALHGAALGIMLAVVAATGVGLWRMNRANAETERGPNLDDMEAIEASLAYRKAPEKQPQKKKAAPQPDEKLEGVSHDETKTPEEKKDEPKKKPDETVDDKYKKYARENTDDEEVGKPEEDLGAFDGSEYGFAAETKGDPYFQALIADLVKGWEYPELLSDVGVPVGCMHLEPDGKIVDTLMKTKSGNSELDDSVDRALTNLVKLRDEEPREVPAHLLKQTRSWICFKFDARKQ
jgi:hypothetical protein